MDRSDVCAETRSVRVVGDGDDNLDIICCRATFKLRFGLEHVFDTGSGMGFDHAFNPNQGFDLLPSVSFRGPIDM